jgi:hypothetical protein
MKFVTMFLFFGLSILAEENSKTAANINKPTKDVSAKEKPKLLTDNQSLAQSKNDTTNESQALSDNKNEHEFVQAEVKPVGLNTVDNDEEGNWLLKKLWWQEGQNAYNDILKTNDDLLQLQLTFLVLKTDAEKKFDEQWLKLNLDEKLLSEKFGQFKQMLSAEKDKRKGDLSENERQELIKIEESEKNLESLKQNLQDLFNYQMQLDDALKEVLQNLKTCRGYETDAWEILQKIAKTLDDTKAREYYLQIEADHKNTQNLANYLKVDYLAYMNKLIQSQNSLFENIKVKLDQLKNNGYRFEKDITKEIKDDEELAKKRVEEKTKLEREKKHQAEIAKAKSKRSFIDNLYFKLNNWFSKIF